MPLHLYCDTLKLLCHHPSVVAHDPEILLITPPPVNEYQLTIRDALKGYTAPQRTAANTRRYADACREVGQEINRPVVDLWHAFMRKAGWRNGDPLAGSKDVERNEVLESLFLDGMYRWKPWSLMLTALYKGLHLSPAGYRVMYEEVMKVIKDKIPDQYPENLPPIYPPWQQAPS